MRKKRNALFGITALLIIAFVIVFTRSPYGIALLKSKDHFIVYSGDSRVLYEPGAEERAVKIAEFLPEAIQIIEEGHHSPFKKSFRVYVCNSQKSHNEFIASSSSYPIRGTALLGNVFIAPSAFSFQNMDTHRGTLIHELSHLHLRQRLGFMGYRKTPFWFTEGIANCLAGTGGEGIPDNEAVNAIMSGKHFDIEEGGGLFKSWHKVVSAAGLTPRMFHKQNKMFVKFIMDRNPSEFAGLMTDIQQGESFFKCFAEYFQADPGELWELFKSSIPSKKQAEFGTPNIERFPTAKTHCSLN
jgi:hypothetical protein